MYVDLLPSPDSCMLKQDGTPPGKSICEGGNVKPKT